MYRDPFIPNLVRRAALAPSVPALVLAFATGVQAQEPFPGSLPPEPLEALAGTPLYPQLPDSARLERVRSALTTLASDEYEGRRTGTTGAARAAHFVAKLFEKLEIVATGNDGYFQRIPMRRVVGTDGYERIELVPGWSAYELLPRNEQLIGTNVVGMVRGTDPVLRDEAVLVIAHLDHVGIGAPDETGDSIYNGADDDASGVVTMLEIARDLAQGPPPRRTVIFLAATGEEQGMLGARWYIQNPAIPLRRTVAALAIEMVGRPDSLAGGPGRAWLTGYERSTMGELLSANGVPIVPDPRPEYDFFMRSDNVPFALVGIPAHTLSSYNLHADYHTPGDEADRIDFVHMALVAEAAIQAVRVLADGPAPEWYPDGRPTPARRY